MIMLIFINYAEPQTTPSKATKQMQCFVHVSDMHDIPRKHTWGCRNVENYHNFVCVARLLSYLIMNVFKADLNIH